jgi:serine/threonine protein kinase
MQRPKDSLENYTFISVIGKGSFAKVTLVRYNQTGELYALKSMKKKYIQ